MLRLSTAVGFASASEELSSQSLILKNMIARFRLTEGAASGESDSHQKTSNRFEYTIIHDDDDSEDAAKQITPAVPDNPVEEIGSIDLSDLGDFLDDDDDKY